MDYLLYIHIILIGLGCVAAELSLRFVFVLEEHEKELAGSVARAVKAAEDSAGVSVREELVTLLREDDDETYHMLCAAMSRGVSAVVELTWSPGAAAARAAARAGAPLLRATAGPQHLLRALEQYLHSRNATDAAILVETEAEVDETLYYLVERSSLRVWVHAGLSRHSARVLAGMRPEPAFYVVLGTAEFVLQTYHRAVKEKLVRRAYRWNLVLTDYSASPPDLWQGGPGPAPGGSGAGGPVPGDQPVMVLRPHIHECCALLAAPPGDDCDCGSAVQRRELVVRALLRVVADTLSKLEPPPAPARAACRGPRADLNDSASPLYRQLEDELASNDSLFYWDPDTHAVSLRTRFVMTTHAGEAPPRAVAEWSAPHQYSLLPGVVLDPIKMFFRIGTAPAVPWSMVKVDPETGAGVVDERGQPVYEGYCIDLIERLAETMDFEYELVTPRSGTFGSKLPNGSWDGVVGDLMRGETDMAVAALTMTAEREEVIDFVPPYFEQTGILIVIRKPSRKTSLFKFMTVLRSEVWASVVGALLLTGTMIWLLDKYSPYSARNNPQAYPYPCREFTLKESFWFALTSFTPQGGGEAPKAASGRALVAAYWLFVVLMLATFTANLAAFLTVERMQTPVSSLEQLARQSRINYTVVESSSVHRYFINMKFAEDTLYRVWKEITLNATSDQAQYRVWDYPIREQYGHILLAINASGPVADAKTGFDQVNEHTDADFAFIHDSAEIRYEVGRNCNLTEVGGVFAEQPYAAAVQQGSRLQELLSRALLDLQKERQLERLASRYWNESARQSCPDADESEGITLESLGGVFIATLFGLGLAMLTLAWEVFYYKRKEKNKLQTIDNVEKSVPAFTNKKTLENKMAAGVAKLRKRVRGGKVKKVTIGDSFKPAGDKPAVAYINVYPKREFRP